MVLDNKVVVVIVVVVHWRVTRGYRACFAVVQLVRGVRLRLMIYAFQSFELRWFMEMVAQDKG